MYTLGPEEKASLVMAYTQNSLVRGELITRETLRLNTWFRTDSAPDFIHLHKAQWLQAAGAGFISLPYEELLLPVPLVIGFHIAPPAEEPLDYDPKEDNRVNKRISLLMGLFVVKGNVRISAQTDLATSLQIAHSPWISIYDTEISSPQLPQMPTLQIPLLLVRPVQVVFIPQE
jgi:protein involved in temperature-dependent protein secretion